MLYPLLFGFGALSIPALLLGVGSNFDVYNAQAILATIPRTVRAISWASKAGIDYYRAFQQPDYAAWSQLHARWAHSLLEVCRANGGVYVKSAQLVSTIGAVPIEYRETLGKLHDHAKPQPFGRVARVMKNELGADVQAVFAGLDPKATAAASIAQVHRAHLLTGEEVAVKVQYPGLHKAVATDLGCLLFLSKVASLVFPSYQLSWVFKELKSKIHRELDFRSEMHNAKALEEKLAHRKDICVPNVHEGLCSSKLLVMQWIEGCKVTDKDCLKDHGINPRSVALSLVDAFSEMTLVHGFVHGDPHPGNVIVKPLDRSDGGWLSSLLQHLCQLLTLRWWTPYQLVLLDHGRYLEVNRDTRLGYCALWCHIVRGDKQKAVEVARRMCHGESGAQLLPRVLSRKMCRDERQKLQREAGLTLSQLVELLRGSPQALVDSLRVVGVVRHVASLLADIQGDRAFIEGSQALRGLNLDEELSQVIDHMDVTSWNFELGVRIRLLVMQLMVYLRSVSYSVSLFTEPGMWLHQE